MIYSQQKKERLNISIAKIKIIFLHKFLCLLLSFLIAVQPALLQAEANHFYGDIQEVVTGKEANTALVDALTASGLSADDANKYQRYVDNGVLVVTLGAGAVAGGRAAYQFTVNSSKAASLSAAERTTLTNLQQKSSTAVKTATETPAASSFQANRLRMQLEAEQVAGVRMPTHITGYTKHGINQAISRDGGGVSSRAIQNAFENPISIEAQSGGRFKFSGKDAVVVLNKDGKVITTWSKNSNGWRQGK